MKLSANHETVQSQSTQAPFALKLAYQPPSVWFKIVQQSLVITDLPAPLHYFNFKALIGQPNIPIFASSKHTHHSLDVVSTINSVSSHMVGQSAEYSLTQDCYFKKDTYRFGQNLKLSGSFPFFNLIRNDLELAVELSIQTQPIISHFSKLKLGIGVYQHWSLLCRCQGTLTYNGQRTEIDQLGSFEYARGFNLPFWALYFYTYQMIQLKDQRQLILIQTRNQYNHILSSKIYLRTTVQKDAICFDQHVEFSIHRVYPKIQTPCLNYMYLPREFEWQAQKGQHRIAIYAQSRGDYKSGLGRGYVGSFQYQIKVDDYYEEGEAGYCEFIDLRPLNWQEYDQPQPASILSSLHPSAFCKRK